MDSHKRSPWSWIPTLYFSQGLPYVVVMTVAMIVYKRMGLSNGEIALYTSWLYLPWVLKPLWSPLVELLGTRRRWILAMQFVIGLALAGVALTLPGPQFFRNTLALFWLMAFSSATHDIAADGFYMLALSRHDQAWFVGVRSTFYRLAMVTGQGALVILAGTIESHTGIPPVHFTVAARPGAVATAPPDPLSLVRTGTNDPIRLQVVPERLVLDTTPRQEKTEALLAQARDWNRTHGFYPAPAATLPGAVGGAAPAPSWWTRRVSTPLRSWLQRHFAPEKKAETRGAAGPVGLVLLYLNRPPDGQLAVQVGRDAGAADFKLVEGERFVWSSNNWRAPFLAVVQVDPKLKGSGQATFKASSGNIPLAWSMTFAVLAGIFLCVCGYHRLFLPRPAEDVPKAIVAGAGAGTGTGNSLLAGFVATFASFFAKPGIMVTLAFLLFYRFAEAQLMKIASLFLLDGRAVGGLGLSTSELGLVYGTVGVIALTLGGLTGGFLVARQGLKFWLPFMVCALHLPNLAFVYLAYAQPENLWIIHACVAVEQFGYGFGFTAYMLYMIHVAEGPHKTAHYALCTGFMALGMMIPGMYSGWLQEIIGYRHFFIWVMISTLPGFLVAFLARKKLMGDG